MSFGPLHDKISKSLGIPERKKIDLTTIEYDNRLDNAETLPKKTGLSSSRPTLIVVDELLIKFLNKIFAEYNVKVTFKSMDKRASLSMIERTDSGKAKLPVMLIARTEVRRLYDKIPGKIDPLMPQAEFVYVLPVPNPKNIAIDNYVNSILPNKSIDPRSGEKNIKGYYVVFPEYVSISYSLECFTSTKEESNMMLEKFLFYDRYYIVDQNYFIQYIGPESYSIENELSQEQERAVKLSFNFEVNCFVFVDLPKPLPVISSVQVDITVSD